MGDSPPRPTGATRPDGIVLDIRRWFAVPPAAVYRAWTEPAALKRWWCPPGWEAAAVNIDLRIGGSWRIAMRRHADDAAIAVAGRFLEVRPGNVWSIPGSGRAHWTICRRPA